MVEMSARWPSARAVCDAVLGKDPHRVHGLRRDSLGILLSLANAGAHARVLVLDGCAGLLQGAASFALHQTDTRFIVIVLGNVFDVVVDGVVVVVDGVVVVAAPA